MTARNLACTACFVLLIAGVISAQETIHVLRKGETIYSVSRAYGVSYSAIVAANKISDANKVRIGQKLIIPTAAVSKTPTVKHTVEKGETLFGIARKYDLTLTELRTLNKLSEKSVLKAGDSLIVARTAASGTVPSGTPAIKAEDPRPMTTKRNDPTVRWPVRVKELAYMEGKLYGVLLTGEHAERVESLSAGTVVSAEAYRGFGRVAIVQAPDGHLYVYGGNESLSVKSGDRVAAGAELGRLGVDSLTGKPSLFFFVYKDNVAIDPAKAPRS